MRVADVCSCMRRLHPDLESRAKKETLLTYKKALDPFLNYLNARWELTNIEPNDLGMLVMEHRTELEITRSQQTQLLASLEFFMPHLKGKLIYTKEAIKGRLAAEPVAHTVPLAPEAAYLFGAFHASRGMHRLAAAMFVQLGAGLRPSELLSLTKDHVFVPANVCELINIRLGVVVSNKIKREQFVQICPHDQPLAYKLMRLAHAATLEGARLFNFSYSAYNASFAQAEKHFGLDLRLTAHSGRAGFATCRS